MQQRRALGSVPSFTSIRFGLCRCNFVARPIPSLHFALGLVGLGLTWSGSGAAEARAAAQQTAGDTAFDARPGALVSALVPFTPLTFDAFDRRRDAPVNEEPNYRSDGVYGRFDGELSLVPSLGMQWTQAGWFTQLGLSAYYLSTVGVVFHIADGRWSPLSKQADFNVTTFALALRPLFLLRWTKDMERGPSFLDLTIDSLTLSAGGYYAQQHSLDLQHQGLETELSFGFPLLGKAHGPWLTASAVNRLPKVTQGTNRVDMAFGLRFEWSFSLGS